MNLTTALVLAATLHAGQKDKGGNDYIWHPIRVAMRLQTEEEQIVAILHDIKEDCGITDDDLREKGFSERIIEAVDALTRRVGETYFEFIKRCMKNKLAARVKLADLEENSDLSRIPHPTQRDMDRVEKRYKVAIQMIRSVLP